MEKGTIDKCLAAVLQRSRILVSEVARNAFDISSLTQDLNTLLIPRVISVLIRRHASLYLV